MHIALKTFFSHVNFPGYFGRMDNQYSTLQTIYSIVKEDSDPTSYLCKPAQIIVRQFLPWDTILVHIRQLEDEGLVNLQQHDRFTLVNITQKGLVKAGSQSEAV